MVAPGFLKNPKVRRWLNGVEPAWTTLELNSLNALRHEPSASNHAIRLEPDLADAEISGSALSANALLLLRRAAETGGLKLTAPATCPVPWPRRCSGFSKRRITTNPSC